MRPVISPLLKDISIGLTLIHTTYFKRDVFKEKNGNNPSDNFANLIKTPVYFFEINIFLSKKIV